jgi:hypothetical protein
MQTNLVFLYMCFLVYFIRMLGFYQGFAKHSFLLDSIPSLDVYLVSETTNIYFHEAQLNFCLFTKFYSSLDLIMFRQKLLFVLKNKHKLHFLILLPYFSQFVLKRIMIDFPSFLSYFKVSSNIFFKFKHAKNVLNDEFRKKFLI